MGLRDDPKDMLATSYVLVPKLFLKTWQILTKSDIAEDVTGDVGYLFYL